MRAEFDEAFQPHVGDLGAFIHRRHIEQAHRKTRRKSGEGKSGEQKEAADFGIDILYHPAIVAQTYFLIQ